MDFLDCISPFVYNTDCKKRGASKNLELFSSVSLCLYKNKMGNSFSFVPLDLNLSWRAIDTSHHIYVSYVAQRLFAIWYVRDTVVLVFWLILLHTLARGMSLRIMSVQLVSELNHLSPHLTSIASTSQWDCNRRHEERRREANPKRRWWRSAFSRDWWRERGKHRKGGRGEEIWEDCVHLSFFFNWKSCSI